MNRPFATRSNNSCSLECGPVNAVLAGISENGDSVAARAEAQMTTAPNAMNHRVPLLSCKLFITPLLKKVPEFHDAPYRPAGTVDPKGPAVSDLNSARGCEKSWPRCRPVPQVDRPAPRRSDRCCRR